MPREFMPLYGSAQNDPDWQRLTIAQQHAYCLIDSHLKISYCGVLDVPLHRLVGSAADLQLDMLCARIDELAQLRYLVHDHDTGEILVRSHIRYDGLLPRGRPARGIASHWRLIESQRIATAVLIELQRLFCERRDLTGWHHIAIADPDLMKQIREGIR